LKYFIAKTALKEDLFTVDTLDNSCKVSPSNIENELIPTRVRMKQLSRKINQITKARRK
jgi:hypothetical protein